MSDYSLVTVEYAPDLLKGTNASVTKRRIKHGSDFKLNCESNENPEVTTAKWYFGAKSFKDMKPLTNELKILSYQMMNSSMQGFYQCIVTNSVGSSTRYFTVIRLPNSKN